MIPRDIYLSLSPGASDDELREIASANDLDYTEVWEARKARRLFYERGVTLTARRNRRR